MLALQIVFCASFQPVDLAFYVDPKVNNHLAQISIMLKLTIVSLGIHHISVLLPVVLHFLRSEQAQPIMSHIRNSRTVFGETDPPSRLDR